MKKPKRSTFQAQAEQSIREQALGIAKGIQAPGQTKEQTRLIAKGIEKGIALYKREHKEKQRERAKSLRKQARRREEQASTKATDSAAQQPPDCRHGIPLAAAGIVFMLVAVAHFARYLFGFDLIIGTVTVPRLWSLFAACASALLAVWMFWARRRRQPVNNHPA